VILCHMLWWGDANGGAADRRHGFIRSFVGDRCRGPARSAARSAQHRECRLGRHRLRALLARRGLVPHLQRPKPRGRPMPPHIARGNVSRARVRVAIEHGPRLIVCHLAISVLHGRLCCPAVLRRAGATAYFDRAPAKRVVARPARQSAGLSATRATTDIRSKPDSRRCFDRWNPQSGPARLTSAAADPTSVFPATERLHAHDAASAGSEHSVIITYSSRNFSSNSARAYIEQFHYS
jgi:hypothetical protein